MNKPNLQKILNSSLLVLLGVVITLLFWRPWEEMVNLNPTKTQIIVRETKANTEGYQKKIDTLETRATIYFTRATEAEKRLYAAQQENKRLAKVSNSTPLKSNIPADSSNEPINDTYSAQISEAAATSDSICNEVITDLHNSIYTKDSIITFQELKYQGLQGGFNQLIQNDQLKDLQIKSINKKLKWQKVQNIGFKAIAATVVALVIKNNL